MEKMVIIKDKLTDTYNKAVAGYYESSEVDRKFDELDKSLSIEVEGLFSELNIILENTTRWLTANTLLG